MQQEIASLRSLYNETRDLKSLVQHNADKTDLQFTQQQQQIESAQSQQASMEQRVQGVEDELESTAAAVHTLNVNVAEDEMAGMLELWMMQRQTNWISGIHDMPPTLEVEFETEHVAIGGGAQSESGSESVLETLRKGVNVWHERQTGAQRESAPEGA